ncbi:MAG: hypothetical protein ACOC1K_02555 [Nanoarchaeota archaeon]
MDKEYKLAWRIFYIGCNGMIIHTLCRDMKDVIIDSTKIMFEGDDIELAKQILNDRVKQVLNYKNSKNHKIKFLSELCIGATEIHTIEEMANL